jgi:hypothetical protein
MLAGSKYLIPVNRRSSLYQYAQANNLGQFLSAEFPVQHQGVDYRAQVFEWGITYYSVDAPESVKHIPFQTQVDAERVQESSSVWSWFKQLIGWE